MPDVLNVPVACGILALAMILIVELRIALRKREVDEEEIINEYNAFED